MGNLLAHRLDLLAQDAHRHLLWQGRRGIERETLRVTSAGELATDPHPVALGSALTHPQITTDYSESLLEFITPAVHDAADALAHLGRIHRFTHAQIGNELLWSQSMPCHLPAEEDIPIAWYGHSHIGMIKHVYRRGLAVRYGKAMQCIAGVHYNYSLAKDLWRVLKHDVNSPLSDQDFQSESYISLARNFHRYSWLLMYLFGASPALPVAFLQGQQHRLAPFSDDTLYLPYATCLRMSDIGYQNKVQAGLMPLYTDLKSYMRSLSRAIRQPCPEYEAMGTRRNGEWIQLNTHLLQIENEYYASIRPKRTTYSGERPLEALCTRGVEYIEVRCLDIDPFAPLGIDLATTRFLDTFLLFCALEDSPQADMRTHTEAGENFSRTVMEGRCPGLLLNRSGQPISLTDWGQELIDCMAPVATLLDAQCGDTRHADALALQMEKLCDPAQTPSARVLAALPSHGDSFFAFGLAQSQKHAAFFAQHPLLPEEENVFIQAAHHSLVAQQRMEREQTGDFDAFVAAYNLRTPEQLCMQTEDA